MNQSVAMRRGEFQPAYLKLWRSGELKRRVELGLEKLADCMLCPRNCHVNRIENKTKTCRTGRHAVVSSYFAHHGEERCLRGTRGSGTIFFSWCNLRCVFCQNYEISWQGEGQAVRPEDLAEMMLALQIQGCHNINFVTPEHVVPQILEALLLAVERGLRQNSLEAYQRAGCPLLAKNAPSDVLFLGLHAHPVGKSRQIE